MVAGPSRIPGPSQRTAARKFTVYTDEEEKSDYEPPPPTAHLSDVFGTRPPPITPHDLQTTTANAVENQPFGVNYSAFQAATSTPVYPVRDSHHTLPDLSLRHPTLSRGPVDGIAPRPSCSRDLLILVRRPTCHGSDRPTQNPTMTVSRRYCGRLRYIPSIHTHQETEKPV